MNETGPGSHVLPLWLRGLAALLPLGLLFSLSGFTRFDVPQTALSAALLAFLAGALALRAPAGAPAESGTALFRATLAVVVAWVAASALLRGTHAAGYDDVVIFGLLGLAAVIGATRGMAPALAAGYSAVALAMGAVGIAQIAGLELPPPIPNVTPDGVRLFGDDAHTGATAALLVASALLALRPRAGRVRFPADLGAAAALFAATLAWPTAGLAIAGIVALAIAATAVAAGQRPGTALRLPGALLLVALIGTAVGAIAAEDRADTPPFVRRPAVSLMEPGPAEPWGLDGALPFYLAASARFALDSPLFGAGPGTFAGRVTQHGDANDGFARSRPNGLPWVHRGPSALAQWTATLGIVVPLGVIAALLLALIPALRARAGEAVGALAALLCLLVVGPGVHGGATLFALGVALGAATQCDAAYSASPQRTTRFLRAAFAVALAVLAVQTARWSYQHAGGSVYMAAGNLAQATPWLERALRLQERYETRLNLGLLASMPTGEEHDFTGALDHLTAAVAFSPGHARAHYALGSLAVRTLGRIAEDPAEALRKRQAAMAVLRRATEVEPNHVDVGVLLAQTHMIGGEFEPALAELARLDARSLPGEAARIVLEALGVYWADVQEDPHKALEYFDRAELLPGDPTRSTRLAQRIQECRQWVVTGQRPRHEPGHGPFGEGDHGHGDEENHPGGPPESPTGRPPPPPEAPAPSDPPGGPIEPEGDQGTP